ncbi:MAG: O-antigen ligase family protein [Candidatus Thiodiazotropha endolucinida]
MNQLKLDSKPKSQDKMWFYLLIFYLLIDIGRIQDVIGLNVIRPGLLSIVMLTLFVLTKGELWPKEKEIKYIWYFIFLLAIYIPFATNNFYAYNTTTTMLFYMPFILSVVSFTSDLTRLRNIINAFLAISFYVAVTGIKNGGLGTGGYLADENDLSLYLNMVFPIFYFLFINENKSKLLKLYYLAGALVCLVAIIISFSRGGFVGFVAVIFSILLFSENKVRNFFVLIVSVGAIAAFFVSDVYMQEMSTSSDVESGTAQERIQSWLSAFYMFLYNPLGVGGNNFQIHFSDYQTDYFRREMWGRVAHSIWFTLLPELGVIGVFLYFNLMFSSIKKLFYVKNHSKDDEFKYYNNLSKGLFVGMIGFFVSGSLLSVLYYPFYWYFLAFTAALYRVATKQIESQQEKGGGLPK